MRKSKAQTLEQKKLNGLKVLEKWELKEKERFKYKDEEEKIIKPEKKSP
jgi:hypothetical protein